MATADQILRQHAQTSSASVLAEVEKLGGTAAAGPVIEGILTAVSDFYVHRFGEEAAYDRLQRMTDSIADRVVRARSAREQQSHNR